MRSVGLSSEARIRTLGRQPEHAYARIRSLWFRSLGCEPEDANPRMQALGYVPCYANPRVRTLRCELFPKLGLLNGVLPYGKRIAILLLC